MYLIPKPKSLKLTDEKFKLKRETEIVLDCKCNGSDLDSAILLQKEVLKRFGFKLHINKSYEKYYGKNTIRLIKNNNNLNNLDEQYSLNIEDEFIEIKGSTEKGIFYGIETLIQIIRQSGAVLYGIEIEDEPYFKNRGFYHDITRGKVPTLETLKELVDRAAFYKINQLQLYIEHTFAFKGMSEVWRDKDPLTSEEILLLDEYCRKRHVELIPSLATFGHLYEVLNTKSFGDLCELYYKDYNDFSFLTRMSHHTLNIKDDRSIKLVEDMLDKFIPLFSSNKFNICCDETFDLGKGKSRELIKKVGTGKSYADFLNKIIKIVRKHNKKVLFWDDIILNHSELLNEIPEDVICLNWNYGHEATEENTKIIADSGREQYVCPGVSGWNQLMNLIWNSFENIKRMVSYGIRYGATGVLNTDWGDYGHINLFANSMPGMIYGASLSWNPEIRDNETFEDSYKAISLIEYGDKSLELISLLESLSRIEKLGWAEVVRWKEKDKNDTYIDDFKNIDLKTLKDSYYKAEEIEEKLTMLSENTTKKLDIEEFIISAKAIKLFNDFFLTLINKDYKKGKEKPINKPYELAEKLEEWMVDFSYIWRIRNKESELLRIKNVVIFMCDYLRDNN